MLRIGHGRRTAALVTVLFREHSSVVYRYLVGVYGREEDAEEVTQEAFLRLHQALVGRQTIESPRAWTLTVARRLMLDRLRHQRRGPRDPEAAAHAVLDPAPSPEEVLIEDRKRAAMHAAMRTLTPIELECMCARASGLKLREIGGMVGLDLRRVAEIVAGAVQKIHRIVRDEWSAVRGTGHNHTRAHHGETDGGKRDKERESRLCKHVSRTTARDRESWREGRAPGRHRARMDDRDGAGRRP